MFNRDEFELKYRGMDLEDLKRLLDAGESSFAPEAWAALTTVYAERRAVTNSALTEPARPAPTAAPYDPRMRDLVSIVIGLVFLLGSLVRIILDEYEQDSRLFVWFAAAVPSLIGANVFASRALERGERISWKQPCTGAAIFLGVAAAVSALLGVGMVGAVLGAGLVLGPAAGILVYGLGRSPRASRAASPNIVFPIASSVRPGSARNERTAGADQALVHRDQSSDTDVLRALRQIRPTAVRRGILAIQQGIPPEDWDRNFLAAVFGAPGELRSAIESHSPFFEGMRLLPWDTELLDVVGAVTKLGQDAFLLQWLHLQHPDTLAELAATYLTEATGQPIVWTRPVQVTERRGDPQVLWAEAVQLLRERMSAETILRVYDELSRSDRQRWAAQHQFGLGMSVRNALREAGFTERALSVKSLDDAWVELLWDTVRG